MFRLPGIFQHVGMKSRLIHVEVHIGQSVFIERVSHQKSEGRTNSRAEITELKNSNICMREWIDEVLKVEGEERK